MQACIRVIVTTLVLLLISPSLGAASPADDDQTLRRGNAFLDAGDFPSAEKVFREALASAPDNAVYRAQLALSLIQQKKYSDAESELNALLARDPKSTAAFWYKAQNSFTAGKHREAIARFKAALPLLDPGSPQVYADHWFVGTSWRSLLYFTPPEERAGGDPDADLGLAPAEVDEMLAAFNEYLRLQPHAPDAREIRQFVSWVRKQRPPSNVKKWLLAPA